LEFLKKHKKAFISSLVGVSLLTILLTLGNRYQPSLIEKSLGFVVTPVQSAFTSVGNWFGRQYDFFAHMGELSGDNMRLRLQNEILSAEIGRLQLVDQDNERLSALLHTDRKYEEYPKIGARIIAKDMSNWYKTFTIDKGSNDGLAKNMVVLAAGGLCGRVSEVWFNSATVVAMIDDTFSVSAQSMRTGDTGFVRGEISLQLEGLCRMVFLDIDADIVEGDEIVTSQLTSIYPPGITIGTVIEVMPGANGTKSALIKPTVDFSRMSTVSVITELFEHNMQKTSDVMQETVRKYPLLTMESADVIGRKAPVTAGFVVNRGEKHQIAKGMPVLGAGGLVGTVVEVGYDYAVIKSFLDNTVPLGVKNAATDALGLLRRSDALLDEGCCLFELIGGASQVEIGDEIVISGDAGEVAYPNLVTVGYVTEIRPNGQIVVRAAVDFVRASSLLIVTGGNASATE